MNKLFFATYHLKPVSVATQTVFKINVCVCNYITYFGPCGITQYGGVLLCILWSGLFHVWVETNN